MTYVSWRTCAIGFKGRRSAGCYRMSHKIGRPNDAVVFFCPHEVSGQVDASIDGSPRAGRRTNFIQRFKFQLPDHKPTPPIGSADRLDEIPCSCCVSLTFGQEHSALVTLIKDPDPADRELQSCGRVQLFIPMHITLRSPLVHRSPRNNNDWHLLTGVTITSV